MRAWMRKNGVGGPAKKFPGNWLASGRYTVHISNHQNGLVTWQALTPRSAGARFFRAKDDPGKGTGATFAYHSSMRDKHPVRWKTPWRVSSVREAILPNNSAVHSAPDSAAPQIKRDPGFHLHELVPSVRNPCQSTVRSRGFRGREIPLKQIRTDPTESIVQFVTRICSRCHTSIAIVLSLLNTHHLWF